MEAALDELILLCGHHPGLLSERELVLRESGYRVISLRAVFSIAVVPRCKPVSLVILCHSLTEPERAAARAIVDECWPAGKVLQLVAVRQPMLRLHLPASAMARGQAALVKACQSLGARQRVAS